jgi:hypothetical protein
MNAALNEFMELLPNGLTCVFCVVGNIFFNFCVNFFFQFAAKSKKLVHAIVFRIQLSNSIVLANLTRADALGVSFPSTTDIRDQFEK